MPQSAYGSGQPIIRIADFHDYESKGSNDLRRLRAPGEIVPLYSLKVGDILINRVNSAPDLGKSLVVESRHLPALFESNMMRFRLKPVALPAFIDACLKSGPGRRELTKNAKWAVNQASINQQDVKDALLPLPPIEIQQAAIALLDRFLTIASDSETNINANLSRAKRLRGAVLMHAFEGKLVPQDPRDEPASAVLARIRKEREAAPAAGPRTRSRARAAR